MISYYDSFFFFFFSFFLFSFFLLANFQEEEYQNNFLFKCSFAVPLSYLYYITNIPIPPYISITIPFKWHFFFCTLLLNSSPRKLLKSTLKFLPMLWQHGRVRVRLCCSVVVTSLFAVRTLIINTKIKLTLRTTFFVNSLLLCLTR